MNRLPAFAPVLVAGVCAALALSGCATQAEATRNSPSDRASETRPAYLLTPCNLGEKWDQARMLKVARYDAPDVDDSLLEIYGPVVANGSCTDADIPDGRSFVDPPAKAISSAASPTTTTTSRVSRIRSAARSPSWW